MCMVTFKSDLIIYISHSTQLGENEGIKESDETEAVIRPGSSKETLSDVNGLLLYKYIWRVYELRQ